jgi:hypothetical protein
MTIEESKSILKELAACAVIICLGGLLTRQLLNGLGFVGQGGGKLGCGLWNEDLKLGKDAHIIAYPHDDN